MAIDWQYITNPYSPGFKKFTLELLKDKEYIKHEKVIEKISEIVNNEKKYKEFGDFILSIWESGFMRAVNENKDALQNIGLKTNVVYRSNDG